MKMEYIDTGKIVKPQGIKGEVKIMPWCESPDFLFDFDKFYINKGQTELVVENARVQKNMFVIKFQGYETIEDAQKLRDEIIYIKRSDCDLEENQCFIQEMFGMDVVDADNGKLYGTMCDFSKTGANNVYHIKFADNNIKLIPAIDDVIIDVNLDENKMYIRPLEGLFND